MTESSLKFGTSGLRGLVAELDGPPAHAYTAAFIAMLQQRGELVRGAPVFIGRDLRASSPSIAARVAAAIEQAGQRAVDCGAVPTPALALYAMRHGGPSVMVTGSHIPEDRNGLKFYRASGEIDKKDEAAITRLYEAVGLDSGTAVPGSPEEANASPAAGYIERYVGFFGPRALAGLRIGVYQHSSVARDLLVRLLGELGAEAVALGRADRFVPVDTEALRVEDVALLAEWGASGRFDAIVSTDGDADRPLIADERGRFVRGDLVGAITAASLNADCVVTPVTSNSGLETCGRFETVARTKVGSPYVIEGIERARENGARRVVGFEANGGVLLGSDLEGERGLSALVTRDAALPIVACLAAAARERKSLSELADQFAFRIALSDRLQNVPQPRSQAFLSRLAEDPAYRRGILSELGDVATVDTTDGVRMIAASGEVVHFRASGNAPELRCYVEADNTHRAEKLLSWGLTLAKQQTDES